MSLLGTLGAAFAGLLARDSAPVAPPTPEPPPQPQFDARALYEALLGMGGVAAPRPQALQLYSQRPVQPEDMARLFAPARPLPGVVPEGFAYDDINNPLVNYGGVSGLTEGMVWLGWPYLAELAQRTEYRRISETIAKDMTRRWFRLQAKGDDDKTEKIAQLEDCINYHKLKDKFTLLALLDGFFGRSHLYIDTGDSDDRMQLKLPLPIDARMIRKGGLKALRVVEPMWCYPNSYNAGDPLSGGFYHPQSWFVMAKEIHATRLLPFMMREMPDLLKPAYSFGGLSMTQMVKPYVDNWLRTRQSVSDLIHSFSTPVMMTNMGAIMNAGASAMLKMRAELFNYLRDNNNLLMIDKTTEDFKNVAVPLGALDHLQAQAQEHMASATGIPLVVLTGISPSGLNATSEGELQVWAQFIHAAQGSFFDEHLKTVLNIMQLSLWGEIDPDISHAWEPLRELTEAEEATARKSDADTDAVYVNAGVLSPDEIRQKLSGDDDSPYQGLDLNTPAPPPPDQDPLGGAGGSLGGLGGGPAAGGQPANGSGLSKPAGGSARPVPSTPHTMGTAGTPRPVDPKQGTRDQSHVDEHGLAPGEGLTTVHTQDPNAEVHVVLGPNDNAVMKLGAADAVIEAAMDAAMDATEWQESQHPRGQGGQFGSGASVADLKAEHQGIWNKYNATPVAERTPEMGKQLVQAWRSFRDAQKAEKAQKAAAKAPSTKPAPSTPAATATAPKAAAAASGGVSGAIAQGLMPTLPHVKVRKDRNGAEWVDASTKMNARGNPETLPGTKGSAGVSVKLDPNTKRAHFYEINNGTGKKGLGAKMVAGVMNSLPPDYQAAVHVDLSEGFWSHIANQYPDRFATDANAAFDIALDALEHGDFNEADHPRDDGGKFTSGGGGGGVAPSGEADIPQHPEHQRHVAIPGGKIKSLAIEATAENVHEAAWKIKNIAVQYKHGAIATYANKVLRILEQKHGLEDGSLGKATPNREPSNKVHPEDRERQKQIRKIGSKLESRSDDELQEALTDLWGMRALNGGRLSEADNELSRRLSNELNKRAEAQGKQHEPARAAVMEVLEKPGRIGKTEYHQVVDIVKQSFNYQGPIEVSDERKTFELNGKTLNYGGAAWIHEGGSKPKGSIVLYTTTSLAGSPEVVAHEIGHQKFQRVLDRRQEEYDGIYRLSKQLNEQKPGNSVYDLQTGKLKEEYRKQFPVYAATEDVWDTGKLQREDGATEYSTEWWKQYESKPHIGADTPAHETIAEMTKLDYQGILHKMSWYKQSPTYRKLYRVVQEFG